MSKPRIATVADAIVAEMNTEAATLPSRWSQGFQIERIYLDRQSKSDLEELHLRVMCGASEPTSKTRKHRQWLHTIQIAVRKNAEQSSTDAIDSLAAFAEEIAEYWSSGTSDGRRIISGTAATVFGVSFLPYSPDVLDTDKVFNSVITLTVIEIVTV